VVVSLVVLPGLMFGSALLNPDLHLDMELRPLNLPVKPHVVLLPIVEIQPAVIALRIEEPGFQRASAKMVRLHHILIIYHELEVVAYSKFSHVMCKVPDWVEVVLHHWCLEP